MFNVVVEVGNAYICNWSLKSEKRNLKSEIGDLTQAESLDLDRYYSKKLMCHKCLATRDVPYSFQELDWSRAKWLKTVGAALPWLGQPAITGIPGFTVETDRWDLLHTFHLGLGRDAAGSALVLLLQDNVWPAANWELRYKAAWQTFLSWCHSCKKRPRMSCFSVELSKSRFRDPTSGIPNPKSDEWNLKSGIPNGIMNHKS